MWLNAFSLDRATAQSLSLAYPLKLAQSQTPSRNTPQPDADSSENESKPSMTISPISPACPFPSIPISEATFFLTFGTMFAEMFGEMALGGNESPDEDLAMTVNNLIIAGKLDEALQVAQKIKDVSHKNWALQGIAAAYTEAGQMAQALQLIEIMDERSRINSLSYIAEKYRVAGQLERAAETIDRAFAAYRTAAKPDSTDPVFTANMKLLHLSNFVSQYIAVERKERAAELSSEILEVAKTLPQQNFMSVATLSSIAEQYASAGQMDKAAEVLSYSLEAAQNIKETYVQAFLLNYIGGVYAELKQPERATEILAQAIALAKLEKGVSEKNVVLIGSARTYGVLGQYDQALQLINDVEPALLREQVKQTLACSQKQARSKVIP
jgi:tetratricopeptide (TPR) repeat protein